MQISEFGATLNGNAQLTKNTSHLFYHASQIGEFETFLNANGALKNTLNSFYHTSQISKFEATLKSKYKMNEGYIKFIFPHIADKRI